MSVGANEINLEIRAGTAGPDVEQMSKTSETLMKLLFEQGKKVQKSKGNRRLSRSSEIFGAIRCQV